MRKKFNWSQLDRDNLYSMLYSAGRDIVGQKLPVGMLQKKVKLAHQISLANQSGACPPRHKTQSQVGLHGRHLLQ
jgi:hypothetical protein